mmetsp:Transcript_77463/g.250635  ORF Transcript_77463/g.250635 Transcript_77463/m.250635 type:complete len:326 (-) Transcript_77463:3872-4849(-)
MLLQLRIRHCMMLGFRLQLRLVLLHVCQLRPIRPAAAGDGTRPGSLSITRWRRPAPLRGSSAAAAAAHNWRRCQGAAATAAEGVGAEGVDQRHLRGGNGPTAGQRCLPLGGGDRLLDGPAKALHHLRCRQLFLRTDGLVERLLDLLSQAHGCPLQRLQRLEAAAEKPSTPHRCRAVATTTAAGTPQRRRDCGCCRSRRCCRWCGYRGCRGGSCKRCRAGCQAMGQEVEIWIHLVLRAYRLVEHVGLAPIFVQQAVHICDLARIVLLVNRHDRLAVDLPRALGRRRRQLLALVLGAEARRSVCGGLPVLRRARRVAIGHVAGQLVL